MSTTDALLPGAKNGNYESIESSDSSDAKTEEINGLKEKYEGCGYWKCRPRCLDNSRTVLVCICWFAFIQSFVVNGINNVNTTSVERRFDLPSSKVGMISSSYDFSAGAAVLFVSYFGTHGHKPRWLSISVFIMACGSLTMASPHFITDLYEYGGMDEANQCSVNGNTTGCHDVDDAASSLQDFLYVLITGQVLHGIGGACLYTLGTVLLDEVVNTNTSPLYIGIMFATAGLGPGVGYFAGGYLLSFWVDFDTMATPEGMTESDPRWVGAWWIGFLIGSGLAVTATVALCALPREMKCANAAKRDRESQAHNGSDHHGLTRPDFGKSVKDLPIALKSIVLNPTFMCITFAGCTEGLANMGLATFLPKLIQNQFGQTAGFSAMLTGILAIPGAAGGQIVGGAVVKKFKLKVKGMLVVCMTVLTLSLLPTAAFWLRCDNSPLVGVDVRYPDESPLITDSLYAECNANCSCIAQSYDAVCATNNVTGQKTHYFSPCYAGCTMGNDFPKMDDCSCVQSPNITLTDGMCDLPSCPILVLFGFLAFMITFCTYFATTPAASATLRCLPDKQRAFGLGIQWCFIRFLGTVPGPILYGAIIDNACTLWQETCDGEQGSCWTYSHDKLSSNIFILTFSLKLASVMFFTAARCIYKPPKKVKTTPNSEVSASGSAEFIRENEV